jgi:hypothetical protein
MSTSHSIEFFLSVFHAKGVSNLKVLSAVVRGLIGYRREAGRKSRTLIRITLSLFTFFKKIK